MTSSQVNRLLSTLTIVLCTAAVSGCACFGVPRMPRIDPSGRQFFVEPSVTPTPQRQTVSPADPSQGDVAVTLSPRTTVAPVGSEVVLLAGVLGSDDYLRTNRRLEWSLSPGGVGHFVAVGKKDPLSFLLGDFSNPRKIDNTFAVGTTSRDYLRLDRGTVTLGDDVCVLRGQGWITLSSPVEGISSVVVYAPSVRGWSERTRTATVHWVDAQWRFPPPAISPAGSSHPLTTSVMRQSNGCPCEGWRVRYEIVDGPPAGFAPDGALAIEVMTDADGQAGVEIFQKEPGPGTNKIAIQVIRPASLGGSNGRALVVGNGSTLKTWTAPDLAIRKTGPEIAGLGTTVVYGIEVSNPGDMPVQEVLVTDELPASLSYLDSNPTAEVAGRQLQWRIGELGAGESRLVELSCRVEQRQDIVNSATATADGGSVVGALTADSSATTTVMSSTLEVRITGPVQATVGSNVTFRVQITNNSEVPATGLLIRDSFDPGLEHAAVSDPNEFEIKRELPDLLPGQSQQIDVTFRVAKAGRLCHTVEVTGADGMTATAEGCVTAVPPIATGTAIQKAQPLPVTQTTITVDKTGPASRNVGEIAEFTISVSNTGNQALTGVKVADRYDDQLTPEMATDDHQSEEGALVWTFETLAPGKTEQLQVHCRCTSPAARTCNRVSVTTREGAGAEGEACLQIAAVEDGLTITAAALREPVAAGKGLTYEILVSNRGSSLQNQVSVSATVPAEMTPAALGTTGPPAAPKFGIDGQVVQFEPLPEISPGQTVAYRIVVRTRQSGKFTFHAELITPARTEPLTAEVVTEVF